MLARALISGPWQERFAIDACVVNGTRRAFHAERGRWSGRPELVKNCDSHRSEYDAVLAMFRKIVQCDIRQPGLWAVLLGELPEAIALSNERWSGSGLAAGVRPGAHVGDAQRCFAHQRRPGGRNAYACHSLALNSTQLAVSFAYPGPWQSRHSPTLKYFPSCLTGRRVRPGAKSLHTPQPINMPVSPRRVICAGVIYTKACTELTRKT